MRNIRKNVRRPVFIGEIADAARERVLRSTQTLKSYDLANAIRREAGAAACGQFVKIVRLAERRLALHTGPFPVEGFEVIETAFVSDCDKETGAIVLTRRPNNTQ